MANPIRVCFVIDWILARGGSENQLVMLIHHLERSRIEPFLVLTKSNEKRSGKFVPQNCPVYYYDLKQICSLTGLKKAFEFRRFLKENKIDAIQAYFPDSVFFASIVGKLSGVPVVFGARRNVGHWMMPWDKKKAKFLNRFFVDKIIANAEACKKAVIEQENAKQENVIIIPNGIEMEHFQNVPTWSVEKANMPLHVGAVGNINVVKGHDIMAEAAKVVLEKHPDIRFEIAGGIGNGSCPKRIVELGIENNFKLLGSLADIPAFLKTLDIAVLPSRAEGLSNGLLEYMATGRPCIATDVGGNSELIEHERNGLLVPSENPQALADAICYYLEHPEKAEQFAKEAKKDITEKYDADRVAALFTECCENVLNGVKRSRFKAKKQVQRR